MNIKIGGQIVSVERYVDDSTDSWGDGGAVELARDKAGNTARALGRLCDLLMSRKLMTPDDLQAVAGGYQNIQAVEGAEP
jgi:hypothetical protein